MTLDIFNIYEYFSEDKFTTHACFLLIKILRYQSSLPKSDSSIQISNSFLRLTTSKFSAQNQFRAINHLPSECSTLTRSSINATLTLQPPSLFKSSFASRLFIPTLFLSKIFEICDKAIAFVTSSYLPLSHCIKEDKDTRSTSE